MEKEVSAYRLTHGIQVMCLTLFAVICVISLLFFMCLLTFQRNKLRDIYTLKCKECGSDVDIDRRSYIIPTSVWVNCNCEGGVSFYVPKHIPDEQIERYLKCQIMK